MAAEPSYGRTLTGTDLKPKLLRILFGFHHHGWLFLIPEARLTRLGFAMQALHFTRFNLMALATAQEFLPPWLKPPPPDL